MLACRFDVELQLCIGKCGGLGLKSEDVLTLAEDGEPSLRLKSAYFSQIVPFRPSDNAEPIFRIEEIVSIQGDIRRGLRPFPHSFPARMPVEVAQAAISALSRPGDIVLDPMIGSGVVAKAALALGRKAIGRDIDPLAIVQSWALCADISADRLVSLTNAVYYFACKILRSGKYIEAQWKNLDDEERRSSAIGSTRGTPTSSLR